VDNDNLVLEFHHTLLERSQSWVPIANVSTDARGAALAWAKGQRSMSHVTINGELVVRRLFDPARDALYAPDDQ
jgi:hypothetical protein